MAEPLLHLIKLSVGTTDVEDLRSWQAQRLQQEGRAYHRTRMFPKRAEELLQGGSIYWVIKGQVLCRQRLTAIEPGQDGDGFPGTLLVLDPELHETLPIPHRAFQGWRYLEVAKAPPDLKGSGSAEGLPATLAAQLRALGVW